MLAAGHVGGFGTPEHAIAHDQVDRHIPRARGAGRVRLSARPGVRKTCGRRERTPGHHPCPDYGLRQADCALHGILTYPIF